MDLQLDEMAVIAGGEAEEEMEILQEYILSLYKKYDCFEKGYDVLLTLLTQEEKDKLRQLKLNVFNAIVPLD